MRRSEAVDVVVVGAGFAGLTLARHLLLDTEKTVLLLDRRGDLPGPRQKVGESTVQVQGYYLGKVLELEQHLLDEHYLKYNLRFHWPAPGGDPAAYEGYTQATVAKLSNVGSFQVDRNVLERHLLELVTASPRCRLAAPIEGLEVELAEAEDEGTDDATPHTVRFRAGDEEREIAASWVVDASGRNRFLTRRRRMGRSSPIAHGASYLWVDGLVDVEKLTGASRRERRRRADRRVTGHLPFFLSTNHFMGDGWWLWVIPLQGKTSLGLVYDREVIEPASVAGPEKLLAWIRRELPLFARALDGRRVLDHGGFRGFSHDCERVLSPDGWAVTGDAGRFTDPLYSPGGDLVAVHNTLIVDAVGRPRAERTARAAQTEALLAALYGAYIPSYRRGYRILGDPHAFSLKYVWELSVYFVLYVFPFLNDLFTERRFVPSFLRHFARLGPVNAGIQELLADFVAWKRERGIEPPAEPVAFDFASVGTLAACERLFYEVGVDVDGARRRLGRAMEGLDELARYVLAQVAAVVLGDERVLTDRAFVAELDPSAPAFEPEVWTRRWGEGAGGSEGSAARDEEPYPWSFDPSVMRELVHGSAAAGRMDAGARAHPAAIEPTARGMEVEDGVAAEVTS